jgi:TRAP-type C4-dicarboxylate transport system permease small subunit
MTAYNDTFSEGTRRLVAVCITLVLLAAIAGLTVGAITAVNKNADLQRACQDYNGVWVNNTCAYSGAVE